METRSRYLTNMKTTNNEGICKLCLEEKQLLKSHILPKWSFKHSKLDPHTKGLRIPTKQINGEKIDKQDQTQDSEYMLCQRCENLCYDNYIAAFTKGRKIEALHKTGEIKLSRDHNTKLQSSTLIIRSEEHKFYELKRALVSIIYKAHFSTKKMYETVKVSKKFLHFSRNFLLGQDDYHSNFEIITINKIFSFFSNIDSSPMTVNLIGQEDDNMWIILLGGMEFTIRFKEGIDKNEETLSAYQEYDEETIIYITYLFFSIKEWFYGQSYPYVLACNYPETYNQDYNEDENCPCGNNETYKNCCLKIWFNYDIENTINLLTSEILSIDWQNPEEPLVSAYYTIPDNRKTNGRDQNPTV